MSGQVNGPGARAHLHSSSIKALNRFQQPTAGHSISWDGLSFYDLAAEQSLVPILNAYRE
jgi:hypothetical protein